MEKEVETEQKAFSVNCIRICNKIWRATAETSAQWSIKAKTAICPSVSSSQWDVIANIKPVLPFLGNFPPIQIRPYVSSTLCSLKDFPLISLMHIPCFIDDNA